VLASENAFYHQAIASFERVRELAPDNVAARFWLAQLYIMARLPARAADALQDPLNHPAKFSLVETNEIELHILAAAAYFQQTNYARASELLETEIARHPDDINLVAAATKAYIAHGQFEQALTVIDRKLKSTPEDPVWLFSKGYVCIQLKNYDDAIAALTR